MSELIRISDVDTAQNVHFESVVFKILDGLKESLIFLQKLELSRFVVSSSTVGEVTSK